MNKQNLSPVKWHVKGKCAEMFGCASISPGATNEKLSVFSAVLSALIPLVSCHTSISALRQRGVEALLKSPIDHTHAHTHTLKHKHTHTQGHMSNCGQNH